jgi:hypothetical protein
LGQEDTLIIDSCHCCWNINNAQRDIDEDAW